MKKLIKNILNISGMVLLGCVAIVGTNYALAYSPQIDALLSKGGAQNQEAYNSALAKGQELSAKIVEEGTVLLKNDDVDGKPCLPLDKENNQEKKINIFGYHAYKEFLYGGDGSGKVQPENSNNNDDNTTFNEALANYGEGFNYNRDIAKLYDGAKNEEEIDINAVRTKELIESSKSYSDVALLIIGHKYSENEYDQPESSVTVSEKEKAILKFCTENYKKTILVVRNGGAMQLGVLKDIPAVSACLNVGYTGTHGITGLPKVLFGDVSPSGKTTDTFPYDIKSSPSYYYTGGANLGRYTNCLSNGKSDSNTSDSYADYVESIYVGYKWYETADEMGVWNQVDNGYGKGYNGVVQFPFGYGLSYTSFDWDVYSVKFLDKDGKETEKVNDDTKIEVTVNVTNTGKAAGKDVVECYVRVPYNPRNLDTAIEKSSVTLADFAKTGELQPGETGQVSLSMNVSDFASYDCYDRNKNGFKGYELEDGDYSLTLQSDAHNVKTVDFSSKGETDVEGKIDFKIESGNDTLHGIAIRNDKVTGVEVKNRFTGDDAVDGVSIDGTDTGENVKYISRSSFTNPLEATKPENRNMSDELKKYVSWDKNKGTEWDNATVDYDGNPVNIPDFKWGSKDTNYKIYDVQNGGLTEEGKKLGADYNDPLWQDVLNQLTTEEARDFIQNSYGTPKIDSIGRPANKEYDGPAQIAGFIQNFPRGTGYPNETLIAQTWSKSLAYQFGLAYGSEANNLNIAGGWAPGANIHRTPLGSRNFEYFSECPVLTSYRLVRTVQGRQNAGVYPNIKHFVCNDTEEHRHRLFNWLTEQALREVYLKPFQWAVQRADAVGLMTTYNRVGATYSGGSIALNTAVARGEWGYKGRIISDYSGDVSADFRVLDQALRAGQDLGMAVSFNRSYEFDYSESGPKRLQYAMREARHHSIYAWLRVLYINSSYNASADVDSQIIVGKKIDSFNWWKPTLYAVDTLIGFGIAFWGVAVFWDQVATLVESKKKATADSESNQAAE